MMRTQSDYYANVNVGINGEYYPMRQNDMTYEEYIASVEKEKNGIPSVLYAQKKAESISD